MNLENNLLIARNVSINNKRTSIRLEKHMWQALKDIAAREQCTIHDICTVIHDKHSPSTTFTAAMRVFIMLYYKAAATEDGHAIAGHGNFKKMIARSNDKSTLYDEKNINNLTSS